MSEALHAAVEHTDTLGELFEQVHSSRDKVRVSLGRAVREQVRKGPACACASDVGTRSRVYVLPVICVNICMHVPAQEFDRTLSRMMLEWCLHKDIRRIAQCLDPHMLGVFVKTVPR